MGRAKLRMELIPKEKTRITTYQKRKRGMIKKAKEFTTLCDVNTVMFILPPNSNEPEVWPENPELIKKTIAFYKTKKGDSGKKTYDLNEFFEDRKKKIEDELMKARKKNMEAKYSTWYDEFNSYTEAQLRALVKSLENKENIVRAVVEFKKNNMKILMPSMLELDDHHKKPMLHHFAELGSGLGSGMGSGLGLNLGNLVSNLGHYQLMNHQIMSNGDLGWLNNDAESNSCLPLSSMKCDPRGYGYNTVYDGGVIYDNVNQWAIPQSMVQVQVPDFVMQEIHNAQAMNNNGGVGDYMMDQDQHARMFMGN